MYSNSSGQRATRITWKKKPATLRSKYPVEQHVVYSIYYNGTLVLPWRGKRGVTLASCVWVRVE